MAYMSSFFWADTKLGRKPAWKGGFCVQFGRQFLQIRRQPGTDVDG
jgi:hypothetical protein